jgi:pantoate kinase
MRAHAPGSVTTVFAPTGDRSLGISFATADGVVADVSPADRTRIALDGERTGFEPIELLLEDLGVTADVALEASVPVGCGFGASGAATLSAALAADAEFGLDRTRDALVEAAHRAEVAAGTGLGDVFIQARGGLSWNVGGGVTRRAVDATVAYESAGGIPTGDVLGDEATMARIREAGEAALAEFDPEAGLAPLFDRGWEFARETGLVTDWVTDAVGRVRSAGGAATMAMVGETVVGTGADGALAEETRITPDGAALR